MSSRRVGLYFGLLALTGGLADPNGGLVELPLLFILKDQLRLSPEWVAGFMAVTVIPRHVGFLFGIMRDRWRPPTMGDRGYFLLASILITISYVWLAAMPISFAGLLIAAVTIAIAFQAFDTSVQALLTVVAQRQLMTGRLSALMEIADNAVSVVAVLVGGWLVTHASSPAIFLAGAAITVAIVLQSFWKPKEIFATPAGQSKEGASAPRVLRSLITTAGFWPVLAILVLYNFSPGWGTPYFYYLTSHLNLSSEAFGACRAAAYAAVVVSTALYSVLCYRFSLKTLLWWAIALNILPGFLFLVIDGAPLAITISAVGGLFTGFGNIALFDLLMRSCPKDLEGTASMLGFSVFGAAGTFGDILGSWTYQNVGFAVCIVLDAVATVLIFPFLLKVPLRITARREGEAETAEELAGTQTL